MIKKTQNGQDGTVWPAVSFVTAVVPVILWVYCLVVSGGSLNEGGSGAVWWLMIIYYWTIGIPLAIISVVSGIKGLKTGLWKLAILSLLLKVALIILIAWLFLMDVIL